jgi:hypothetical protein
MLLIKAGPVGKVPLAEPLVRLVKEIHSGAELATAGEKTAWSWQHDTLTVLARNTHGRATEIAALIDDRFEHLGQQHKLAWQDWLRLSNLLNLRLQDAHLVTWKQVDSDTAPVHVDAVTPDVQVELGGPWADLVAQAVGPEQKVLELLAGHDVPVPTLGHETEDGLPLSISWPDYLVAIDLELTDDDRDELVGLGWIVVPADEARAALDRAGVQ